MRSWEVIPSVVRKNGSDTFVLEVDANGPVQGVSWEVPANILSASGLSMMLLRDDGTGNDRASGDYIFTSETLRLNPESIRPIPFYLGDSNSPPGLDWEDLGNPMVTELDGSATGFLITPMVGSLDPAIPLVGVRQLNSNLQMSGHFLNAMTEGRVLQLVLRQTGWELDRLSRPVYWSLPDVFDFLVCISSDHVESLPRAASANFNCGMHITVKLDYSGSVRANYDNAAYYGSAGRLKSFNVLDNGWRGVYANNCAHEITHLWGASVHSSFNLSADYWHYANRSSIGSLVGGQLWSEPTPGKFFMNCEEGRNGAHHAPPLDKYFMGLIGPDQVPVSRVYSSDMPPPLWFCDQEITNIVSAVPISSIVALQGLRTPGPESAQRDFQIGFIAESRSRFFTAVEMTFYDILAEWFTKSVPAGEPDPYLAYNWVPIERFFGENTKWHSRIDPALVPHIAVIRSVDHNGINVLGTGFPLWHYDVWTSTNLLQWSRAAEVTADSNGMVEHFDPATNSPARFFRLGLKAE